MYVCYILTHTHTHTHTHVLTVLYIYPCVRVGKDRRGSVIAGGPAVVRSHVDGCDKAF